MSEQGEQPVAESQPEETSDAFESKLDAKLDAMSGGAPEEKSETPSDTEPAEADGGEQSPDPQTQEEFDEIEFEAERYKVPKKLKDAFLRQSDYTKKTQEVAEARTFVALQIQAMQQEQAFQTAVAPDVKALQQLEAEISRYNGLDWSQLDTDTLVKTKHRLDTLKEQKSEAEQTLQTKRHQFNQHNAQLTAQQTQKANEWLSKQIPQWGEATQKAIVQYGQAEGFTEAELSSIRDPRYVKTLWKAQQWDKFQAEKNTVTKRANGAPPVIRPTSAPPPTSEKTRYTETVKSLHQAKDPQRKKALFDSALELKMKRMGL